MTQAANRSVPRNAGEENLSKEDMAARIDQIVDALFSTSEGATAPASPPTGMPWLDTTGATYPLKMWDGVQWAILGTFDPATGLFTPYRFSPAFVRAVGIASGTVVAASTPTKISYVTEEADVGGHYAGGIYTVPATGIYDIRYGAFLTAQVSDYGSHARIYVNGSPKARGVHHPTSFGARMMPGANMLPLSAGDTVEIYVTHFFGSAITINAPENDSERWYFEAMRVG